MILALGLVNIPINLFALLEVLDNDVAVLKGILTESHLQALDVGNLLLELVVFGAHQFLGQHVLVLGDKGLLRAVEVD